MKKQLNVLFALNSAVSRCLPSKPRGGDTAAVQSTINDLDGNHKLVNEIYLSTLIAGVDTFTEEQLEDLETIAQMCYVEGGASVYNAMALLSYAYKTPVFYDCEDEEVKSCKPLEPAFILAAVYPNPTMGNLVIENYCTNETLVELVNQLGKKVLQTTLPQGPSQQIFSLASLPAGLYMMHLMGCSTTMKQIIVKTQ